MQEVSISKPFELSFTGNWFIDAGILGFVNLMEEVYKWDLETIKKQVSKEKFYYAYFVYYIKNTLIKWIQQQEVKKRSSNADFIDKLKKDLIYDIRELKTDVSCPDDIQKLKEQIKEINNNIKSKIKEKFEPYESELKKSPDKTILEKIKRIGIIMTEPLLQNWGPFNPSVNKEGKEDKVLEFVWKTISENKIKIKDKDDKGIKNVFDKTISKFMHAEEKFVNISYCAPKIDELDRLTSYSIIFLLSFPIAFNRIFDRNIIFYINDLKTCYHINKIIKKQTEKYTEKYNDSSTIFKVTWQSIIDYITEQKSIFSLEDMYIIEYRTIEEQDLIGVEYIGIPKLQASILLDDTIRQYLNNSIEIDKTKSDKNSEKAKKQKRSSTDSDSSIDRSSKIWILEEFIKGRPLYPLIVKHIKLAIKGDAKPSISTSIYTLSVDANVAKLSKSSHKVFAENFFDSYRDIVDRVKEDVKYMFMAKNVMSDLFKEDERKPLTWELFSSLKAEDMNAFLNIILKHLNAKSGENKTNESKAKLLNYNYMHLLREERTWKHYALPLIIGLLGDKNESEQGG